MDYTRYAIDKLKRYNDLKISIDNIKERLMTTEMDIKSIKTSEPSQTPIQSGNTNISEDRLIGMIAELSEERELLRRIKNEVKQIDRAFGNLSEEERLVLERFFVCRPKDHIQRLMDELGYEKTQVYFKKDKALEKFTRGLYGIVHV